MSGDLQINAQSWQLWGSEGMKLFLPRQHRDRSVYFQMDWSFVPPAVPVASVAAETPKLRLRLIGMVPGLADWRELENLFLGYGEAIGGKELPDTCGPDMWIFQPGATTDPEFSKWETNLQFGERRGYEFGIALTALKRSERASKFLTDLHVKQFFKQPVPAEWEMPEWINEGDELSFEGRIEFKEVLCNTPFNVAQPLTWADQMSRRELAVEEIAACTLTDTSNPIGKKLAKDAVGENGRLVVVSLPAT